MNDTQPHKLCPRCQRAAPLTDAYCQGCGRRYQSTNPMGPQAGPLAVAVAPKQDLCGVASLACALVAWWVFGVVLAPAAFILGIIGNTRITNSAGQLRGRAAASIGGLLGLAETWMLYYGG